MEHDHVFIDWLTFSHDREEDLRPFLRGELTPARPWWPYKWAREDADGVKVLGGGPEGRPYLLDLRGEALRRRRAEGIDDYETVTMAARSGLRCTRMDLSRDTTGDLTPRWLRRARTGGRTITAWRRWKWTDEDGRGEMYRCGGKESLVTLRVYNKRDELARRGEPCPFPRLTRWELVLRGDRAATALRMLSAIPRRIDETTGEERWAIHAAWCAWVSKQLAVTARAVDGENKHQGRATIDSMWAAFVAESDGSVVSSTVTELGAGERAARLVRWFRSACGPSLFVLGELVGWPAVRELARRCRRRVGAGHRSLFEDVTGVAKRAAEHELRR